MRELDANGFIEVHITDDERRQFIYWVQMGDHGNGGAYDFAFERAIEHHRKSHTIEIARNKDGDLEHWACEPFTRYEGEVIFVPTSGTHS